MNDLELAVRTVEDILPDMPTKGLYKWKGILESAIAKIDRELDSAQMHACGVCGFEEYGHRTELPVGWRERGDLVLCFKHEDKEIAEILEKAIEADKPEPVDTEDTLEELMAQL